MPRYPVYFNKEEDKLLSEICEAEGCKPYTLMKDLVLKLAEQIKKEEKTSGEERGVKGDSEGSTAGDNEDFIELED